MSTNPLNALIFNFLIRPGVRKSVCFQLCLGNEANFFYIVNFACVFLPLSRLRRFDVDKKIRKLIA